jgi:hypothetical protein
MDKEPDFGTLVRVEFSAKDSNKVGAGDRDVFGRTLSDLLERNASIFRASSGACGCARSLQRSESRGTTNSILVRSIPFGPPVTIV